MVKNKSLEAYLAPGISYYALVGVVNLEIGRNVDDIFSSTWSMLALSSAKHLFRKHLEVKLT
jgi:hypothetical protein